MPLQNSLKMEYSYRSKWFVGREKDLDRIRVWESKITAKRIFLISAPPKTGKSWFLGRSRELLSIRKIPFAFIDIAEHLPSDKKITSTILEIIVNELSEALINRPLHEGADLVAHLQENVVPRIRPDNKLIIFDGLDEVSEEDWQEFQSVILNNLFRQSNLRFILAARDEFKLIFPLPRSTDVLKLPAFDNVEAQAHLLNLENIISNKQNRENLLARFLLDIEYTWNHAGTNTFIYKCVEKQRHPFPIDEYLMALEVVEEEQLPKTKLLLQVVLSTRKAEWTEQDFATAYYALHQTSLNPMEVGAKMSFLMSHSLVSPVEGKPRYYKTAFGISVIAPLLV